MDIYQILGLLIVIVLIVWWALRRSSADSNKDLPVAGHTELAGIEEQVGDEEHATAAVRTESVENVPEPAPEPMAAAAIQAIDEVVEPAQAQEIAQALEPVPAPEPVSAPEPASEAVRTVEVIPDDLVIIEGIGPRISGVLKGAGIKTFAQLAEMEPEQIKEVLSAVDERLGNLADPTTWPQQASLAARGEMEALQALQENLKAGRSD